MKKPIALAVLAAVTLGVDALAQNLQTGPFTAQSASAGRALYVTHCAACRLHFAAAFLPSFLASSASFSFSRPSARVPLK